MAKIVIDAREYSTSTGRYVSKLIEYLEKLDKTNDYVILLKPADMSKYKPANPRFKKVVSPYKEFTFGEQLGLAWQLYKLNGDLVHFGMTQQPILYLKKSVTTIHDLTTLRFINPDKNPAIFLIKQQIYKLVVKYAAKKSKAIITPSQYVKEDLVKYTSIKPRKVHVTHEAADKITDPPEPVRELEGRKFIMYIGRPTPHKNLWRLIEAFDSLKAVHPDLYLVLAGKMDRNYSDIKRRAESNSINNIVFTDYISEGQLRWLYENCRAYVFPSLSEGFGLPGLEAMAHGAPVVSANTTCLPEIYADAARYFDPLDKYSISSAINDVIEGDSTRRELIKKGFLRAGDYSWSEMAKATLDIYNRLA